MFKKKEKPIKEKKIRTMKVGTHKKSVIALWVVLIASVSFGVYKNFTAIDQHTTHEVETIQLRLNDTNGIENFCEELCEVLLHMEQQQGSNRSKDTGYQCLSDTGIAGFEC